MDTVTKSKRSDVMRCIRSSRNKSTEIAFMKILRKNKITGWRRNYQAPGKPDFVFPKQRLAVFVDGCFWHNCPLHCRLPKTNRKYWINKIMNNKKRDKAVNQLLKLNNWVVLRFWEHDLKGGSELINKKLRKKLSVFNGQAKGGDPLDASFLA